MSEVITDLRTGLNPRKNFQLNTDDAAGYYITVRELGGKSICPTEKTDRVNQAALRIINGRSHLKVGDVLFSATGTIGNTALVSEEPLDWNIKEGVYALTPNPEVLNSLFLLYWMHTSDATQQFAKASEGGTVKSVSMAKMNSVQMPLPSLEEQQRIVDILDRFDALTDDISQGLPAEIAARRKQYEYYRDKLLTFKRKAS